jgi:tetratricopeptide (TPR) repeat protein
MLKRGFVSAESMAMDIRSYRRLTKRTIGWWFPAMVGLAGIGCQPASVVAMPSVSFSEAAIAALRYPPFLIDPQTAARYRQQGLAFRNSGDTDRAIATLKIAAALDPLDPNNHVILGWTQHLAGNRAAAAQTLQTALGQDPDYVPALNALGIVFLVDGQLDDAIATHTRAAELKPDNEIAHYNLSLAYQRSGQFDQAIAHGQTATELEPGNPHPWVALALAYWSNGEAVRAGENYRQALRLDGRYGSLGYLDHLERAGFSQEQIAATGEILATSRD